MTRYLDNKNPIIGYDAKPFVIVTTAAPGSGGEPAKDEAKAGWWIRQLLNNLPLVKQDERGNLTQPLSLGEARLGATVLSKLDDDVITLEEDEFKFVQTALERYGTQLYGIHAGLLANAIDEAPHKNPNAKK